MQLEAWENHLRPYLSTIELLDEIPLDRTQFAELGDPLQKFIPQRSLTRDKQVWESKKFCCL